MILQRESKFAYKLIKIDIECRLQNVPILDHLSRWQTSLETDLFLSSQIKSMTQFRKQSVCGKSWEQNQLGTQRKEKKTTKKTPEQIVDLRTDI